MNYLVFETPGPKVIKYNMSINLQKFMMPFYITGLMFYYDNFSDAMFYYLILHGSYGIMWYIKDTVFPDPSF